MKTLFITLVISCFSFFALAQNTQTYVKEIKHDTLQPSLLFDEFPLPQQSVDTIRDVYFVHGLGGSSTSWNLTAEHLEMEYKLRQFVPLYVDYVNGDLNSAAKIMISQKIPALHNIQEPAIDPNTAIMIAHSQGGLVGKAMDRLWRTSNDPRYQHQHFNGLVTFGSAHGGAEIINKAAGPLGGTGELQDFLEEGCRVFSSAYIQNLLPNNWLTSIRISNDQSISSFLGSVLPSTLCQSMVNTLLPVVISKYMQPIVNDYKLGAPMVDTLNNYATDIPVVTFYGDEKEPQLFRMMSTFSANQHMLTSADPFGWDDDDEMVNKTAQMISYYEFNFIFQMAIARAKRIKRDNCYGFCFWYNPQIQQAENTAWANLRAAIWLRGANDRWLDLIGATAQYDYEYTDFCENNYIKLGQPVVGAAQGFTQRTYDLENCGADDGQKIIYKFTWSVPGQFNECDCEYYDNVTRTGNPIHVQREYLSNCPNGGYTTQIMNKSSQIMTDLTITEWREANDGLILASSAEGYPDAVAVSRMRETNHMQMRNCTQTSRSFESLFGGQMPNTDFFKISKR